MNEWCLIAGLLTVSLSVPVHAVSAENRPSGLMCELLAFPEKTVITDVRPDFSWVVNSPNPDELQVGYELLVASSAEKLASGEGDLWDSGRRESSQSVAVEYAGRPLSAGGAYWWKVRTYLKSGVAPQWSAAQQFILAAAVPPETAGEARAAVVPDRYLPVKGERKPVTLRELTDGAWFADFGKAAFGTVVLALDSPVAGTIEVHLGEENDGGRLNRKPGGTRRYRMMPLKIEKGRGEYTVAIHPDKRNTGGAAIRMPASVGEVMPFRYCELSTCPAGLKLESIRMVAVNYPFDDGAADFHCSDETLNAVWELCKYSIKATSFCGVYVDGDRERIPYEADAYINQLSHYCTDREYAMARYTSEYLLTHPTWPTEWAHHSVFMAWADYMYTGDSESMARCYEDLKAKTLYDLARDDGLISTKDVPQAVLRKLHVNRLRDIVDWPTGERDGYDFKDINTVVNMFHYQACVLFSRMAERLGHGDDAAAFRQRADRVGAAINTKLFDARRGVYVDGEGSTHASLHANMWALAFELVPAERVRGVVALVKSRGMACSVYGSQYLLEGLYAVGEDDYALSLLCSRDTRSWWNMIREGSTITMEAWGNAFKSNQDWNHAWGAAPANLIPRMLMGVTPLEPGFGRIRIKPRVGSLTHGELKLPTVRGAVRVEFRSERNRSFALKTELPANMTAEVHVPVAVGANVLLDGHAATTVAVTDGVAVLEVGSGEHTIIAAGRP